MEYPLQCGPGPGCHMDFLTEFFQQIQEMDEETEAQEVWLLA